MPKLEAGRELDALVAEKVMGWERKLVTVSRRSTGGDITSWSIEALVFGDRIHALNASDQPCNVDAMPKFSTDIAAAWEVRNKIGAMRFSVRMKFIDELWRIVGERAAPELTDCRFSATMIPLLMDAVDIALAALKAVEGGVDVFLIP